MAGHKAYDVYADSRRITHEEWLEHRKSGIGGSDAGAIMGVNPYKGPFSVWADKRGYESSFDDTEATRQGRDLENYAALRFSEKTGKGIRREYGMLRSREFPFMTANFDRVVVGQKAGLECKWSRDIYKKRWRDGEMPMEYYCQCLHYMAVSGWDVWYLVVVIALTEVMVYKISRGARREEAGVDHYLPDAQEDIDALTAAEEAFWRDHVESGNPPPPDALKSTSEALGLVYGDSEDCALYSTEEDDLLIEQMVRLKEERKAADREIRRIENRLKGLMKEAEELRSSIATVTWKPQKHRRISAKLLKEKYPMVDIESVKTDTEGRVFRMRTEWEEEE